MCTSNPEALITAARHYCQDNFNYWANRYSNERTGSRFPTYSYSDGDYDLFPRYNVLSAILDEVEKLVGITYNDLRGCGEELIFAGQLAESLFTEGEKNEIAKRAMNEEREKFVHFIENVTPEELENVEPLPFRRRLLPKEQQQVRQQLLDQWNYDGGVWDPLTDKCPTKYVFLMKDNLRKSDYDAIIEFI